MNIGILSLLIGFFIAIITLIFLVISGIFNWFGIGKLDLKYFALICFGSTFGVFLIVTMISYFILWVYWDKFGKHLEIYHNTKKFMDSDSSEIDDADI